MAHDPDAGLLYVGTGNGSPWNRDHRSPGGGDNLYLSSILALDPADGRIVWHYQTTPGDDWDYTATQPLMLLDLEIDRAMRSVIVQAPKNGFFYVIDRHTGELISAEPFTDDLTWATHVDLATGRPVETLEARYGMTGVPAYLSPGPNGAHNWPPMSWSPLTGLVYIPAQNNVYYFRKSDGFDFLAGRWNTGTDSPPEEERPDPPDLNGPPSFLQARDPVTNSETWRARSHGGARWYACDRGWLSVLGHGLRSRGTRSRERERDVVDGDRSRTRIACFLLARGATIHSGGIRGRR